MLFHFDDHLITNGAVREYLKLLPLYADTEEAQSVHKLFFEQILAGNPVFSLPELASDLTQCVSRVIRIAQDKADLELLDDDGMQKAMLVVAKLKQA